MNEEDLKKALGGLLKTAKEKRALEDEQRKAKNEEDRRSIFESVGKDIGKVIGPYIDALNSRDEASHTAMGESLKRIITESIKIDAPGVDTSGIESVIAGAFANLKIPTPQVSVSVPPITVPEIKMPDFMRVAGDMTMSGVTPKTPLHVIMMDQAGKPMMFPQAMGASGGRADFFTIKDIQNSSGGSIIDNDGNLKVAGSFSVTASNSSTQIIDSSTNPISQANPLPVTVVSGGGATTGSALVDSSGVQYSGSNPVPVTITSGASATSASNIVDSSGVAYSGSNPLPITGPVVVSSITASTAASIVDSSGVQYSGSNPVPVTGTVVVSSVTATIAAMNIDSSGVGYSGSNPLPVTVVSGAGTSTKAQVGNSDGDFSVANPLPISPSATGLNETNTGVLRTVLMTDAIASANVVTFNGNAPAQGNNEIVAGVLRVMEMSGNVTSANVVTFNGNAPAQGNNETNAGVLRTILMTDSVSSVVVNSGTITTVTTVGTITNSVSAAIVDSGGVAYSGSNPIPTTIVSGALTSTVVVGDSAARTADNAGNPVKVGGIARTTNPTAFADGDRSNFTSDKLGRQLTRPVQVRDLIATAYVTLSTGTEATLLAAGAGTYLDLIYIMGANTSGVAQQVDVRNTSAGNIVMSLYIPANSTAGVALPVPYPQDATGNSWTVDMADVTNSNILISALFSKEV